MDVSSFFFQEGSVIDSSDRSNAVAAASFVVVADLYDEDDEGGADACTCWGGGDSDDGDATRGDIDEEKADTPRPNGKAVSSIDMRTMIAIEDMVDVLERCCCRRM